MTEEEQDGDNGYAGDSVRNKLQGQGISEGQGLAALQLRICGRGLGPLGGDAVGGQRDSLALPRQAAACGCESLFFIHSSLGRLDSAGAKPIFILPLQGP